MRTVVAPTRDSYLIGVYASAGVRECAELRGHGLLSQGGQRLGMNSIGIHVPRKNSLVMVNSRPQIRHSRVMVFVSVSTIAYSPGQTICRLPRQLIVRLVGHIRLPPKGGGIGGLKDMGPFGSHQLKKMSDQRAITCATRRRTTHLPFTARSRQCWLQCCYS